jgi:hypothetical protein
VVYQSYVADQQATGKRKFSIYPLSNHVNFALFAS